MCLATISRHHGIIIGIESKDWNFELMSSIGNETVLEILVHVIVSKLWNVEVSIKLSTRATLVNFIKVPTVTLF